MSSELNKNEILIDLKLKVIRFTGEKFPSELWNGNRYKKNKNIPA
tara:strand:- start:529 stop:663 length:135 start_codon:yes stop_codon:yes gene_type:complete